MAEPLAHDDVGLGERALRIAQGTAGHHRDIVGPALVKARRGGQRLLGRDEGRARLVVHDHPLERVGQAIGIVGHHHGHRLAHVTDHVPREDGRGEGPALVRALGAREDGPDRLGQIGRAPRRDDAGQ